MKAKVLTDSGSGLSAKQASDLGIAFLPLQVTVDNQQYLDGINLDIPELYKMLDEGKMPSTSQPPLLMQEELFEDLQKDGYTDLILINLSNGLSGTNATLQATAARLGLNVHTLDIYSTLYMQKYMVLAANQLLQAGKEPEEIIEILKKAVDNSNGYLIVEDLDHLAAGGRLTPLAAKLGGMLKIKPILKVGKETEGKVDAWEKVRTFNKAVKKAAEKIASEVKDDVDNYEFFMLNGENEEGTEAGKQALIDALGKDVVIHTDPMYAVIACHTGLGSVGFQYAPKIEGVNI
ncbi:DegV family protein [Ileibacterium valens]|uniref:DegV family protein n=1 Tax=Ileibacterium valens TaxID=1862668 RepID=UPI00259B7A66|nr:DegV family protein [Ileibacterium valens]